MKSSHKQISFVFFIDNRYRVNGGGKMKKGLAIALTVVGAAAATAVILHKCHCKCEDGECKCKKGCCGDIDNEVVKFLRDAQHNHGDI